ncbi:hypothetical protein WH5701_00300 [Synechococcus sp. WH 5701]|nr:hypothetical protein WH5701_00300 [Synechococcus sp. WH 5701]
MKLLAPFPLQIRQQQVGRSTVQHPSNAAHRQFKANAARILQQPHELLISQGNMGSHHHQPRQPLPVGAASSQPS